MSTKLYYPFASDNKDNELYFRFYDYLSLTDLISRFLFMTAQTREFPMMHIMINTDVTPVVTATIVLDMTSGNKL